MALASATQEALWLQQLVDDLEDRSTAPTTLYGDNQTSIFLMAKNPQFHGRSKHIAIKYHFVREKVDNNDIVLKYCCSEDNIADILTKGLTKHSFDKLRAMTGLRKF